ncbi:protein hairless-like [Macrobrachium rosenbergii]|uniref:protein hairless-like n=1 Tax=Macrobrachium rosenbergii TaxID=79674 RepID=UPI0034D5901C
MKNKTETLGNEMSKPGLEGGGGGLVVKVEKQEPLSPRSPPPSPSRIGGVIRAPTPPTSQKIKCESPAVSVHAASPRPVSSPPPSGPGAEVKGKPGTPIPSGSVKGSVSRPASALGCPVTEDASKATTGSAGGRLTFFKEGRFVLELSHRTEMGAPAGWVAVKSKTYWPPPSSATTTTTQHPLRHDTPTSQSDDCSSLNSSPWTSEHVRKQSVPRRNKSAQPHCVWQVKVDGPSKRRKCTKIRRNPFIYPVGVWESSETKQTNQLGVKPNTRARSTEVKKTNLESKVQLLEEKLGLKVDLKVSIKTLFEKPLVNISAEPIDPTFVSPRKRYLRQMEDQDSSHRKKLHSVVNSLSQISGERPSSSSPAHTFPNRSAINSQTSSAYSIDSILNNETANRKSDSFLRTLLKPEPKPSVPQSKGVSKERSNNEVVANTVKVERPERTERAAPERMEALGTVQNKDRKDPVPDHGRFAADRYPMSGYGSLGSLASLYGLNLINPHYMMLPSLTPPMSSQQTEMAVAAATAAAAALSGYPLNHLHSYPHIFTGGIPTGYPPTTTFGPLLRPQQHPSRSSPHPMAHSPSPKPSQASSTPASPHMSSRGGSPRGATSPWQPPPPAHPFSPQKPLSSPPSPPQDAPLNLSKPRSHVEK